MFEVFGFYKFKKLTTLKKNKILLQGFLVKKNIRGTIIIANEGMRANAEYEKKFYNRPYEIFNNLPDAIKWLNTIIEKENKKKKLN